MPGYFGLSGLNFSFVSLTRGDALRACPLAFISRAFGALQNLFQTVGEEEGRVVAGEGTVVFDVPDGGED